MSGAFFKISFAEGLLFHRAPNDDFRLPGDETVIAALDPLNGLFGCRQVVITDGQSRGRTDVVTQSGTGDVDISFFLINHCYFLEIVLYCR